MPPESLLLLLPDPETEDLARTALAEFRLDAAGTAQAAFDRAHPPAALVADVGQLTPEWLARWRAHEVLSAVPIVLVSSPAEVETCEAYVQAGAHDYLIRPFSAAQLRQRVRQLIAAQHMARDLAESTLRQQETQRTAQRAQEQTYRLWTVTQVALAHLPLSELLEELLDRVRSLLNADTTAFLMLDPERNELVARAARGLEEEVRQGVRIPMGKGFAGRVAAERRPIAIEHVDHTNVLNPILREKGIESLLGAPLIVANQVIGIVHIGTLTPRRFTEADMELLQLVADHAALAIDDARLLQDERLARRAAEKAATIATRLQEATAAFTAALTAAEVAHLALEQSRAALGAQAGLVALWDASRGQLELAHAEGYAEDWLETVGPGLLVKALPPLEDALRAGQAVWLASAEELAAHYPSLLLHPTPYQALAVIPLVGGRGNLGALALSFHEPQAFDPDERGFALTLSALGAQAIERARFFDQAQEAIQARDQFLSIASHELKTPITVLRGVAQGTLRRIAKTGTLEPARVTKTLHAVDQQSARLVLLINQLLDISRIQAGHLKLDPEWIDLIATVNGTVESVQLTTTRHAMQVVGPETLRVWADPLRIEQIMLNLLDNAVKYSPDGGPIHVAVSLDDATQVRLAVSDHGVGVAPDGRARLFEPYYRVETPHQTRGLGLGLFISRYIARLHGGDLQAEFPPEGGTRFVLSLPAPNK